jgi:hypothetical protein
VIHWLDLWLDSCCLKLLLAVVIVRSVLDCLGGELVSMQLHRHTTCCPGLDWLWSLELCFCYLQ